MVNCPHCFGEVEVSPQLDGQPVSCPLCGGVFRTPGELEFRKTIKPKWQSRKKNNNAPFLLAGIGGVALIGLVVVIMNRDAGINEAANKPDQKQISKKEQATVAEKSAGALAGIVLVAGGLLIYFLPTIVALSRSHHNIGSILVVNLFFGWTLLGWVVSLSMASSWVRTGKHL